MSARLAGVLLVVVVALAAPRSQASGQSGPASVPVHLQVGLPQGEFAKNVNAAFGIGGGAIWRVAPAVGLRADVGVMVYGSETRRVPLGGGALGLINVDVTTTNSILGGGVGAQLGLPGRSILPYVGGTIGFSAFTTTSSVVGSNSSNDPFATTTNSGDVVFSQTAFSGLYVPLGSGSLMLDLGARYTWNGRRVRYLTPGDITEDAGGNVVLTPKESRADLVTFLVGVSFRPKRSSR